jgi:hypothetical protein
MTKKTTLDAPRRAYSPEPVLTRLDTLEAKIDALVRAQDALVRVCDELRLDAELTQMVRLDYT